MDLTIQSTRYGSGDPVSSLVDFPSGLNPLLMPKILEIIFQSKRLTITDYLTFRLVSKDWLELTTTTMLQLDKGKLVIKGEPEIKRFTQVFAIPKCSVPCKTVEIIGFQYSNGRLEKFMRYFGNLVVTLVLSSGYTDTSITDLEQKSSSTSKPATQKNVQNLMMALIQLAPNLKHLSMERWELDAEMNIQSGIKSLALTKCSLDALTRTDYFANILRKNPDIEQIDISKCNQNPRNDNPVTNGSCIPLLLSKSLANAPQILRKITSLKIPYLNNELVEEFNRVGMKLQHFHTEVAFRIFSFLWKIFLQKQEELRSLSIVKYELDLDPGYVTQQCLELPKMQKLDSLHIRGGGPRHVVWEKLPEQCPKLDQLLVGYLPTGVFDVLTNTSHKITSLVVDKPMGLDTILKIAVAFPVLRQLNVKIAQATEFGVLISKKSIYVRGFKVAEVDLSDNDVRTFYGRANQPRVFGGSLFTWNVPITIASCTEDCLDFSTHFPELVDLKIIRGWGLHVRARAISV